MSPRFNLPQAGSGDHESARRRLGGRARSQAGAGHLVSVTPRDEKEPRQGVVLFVDPGVWHVWLGGGRVLKTETVEPLAASVGPELAEVARAARDFAAIEEGDEVLVTGREGSIVAGTVHEKCRYGALVLRADGRLVAVGFARLQQKFRPLGQAN